MEIIPPVEIGLLVDHANLPSRESVLALFAEHYRGSLERAAAAAEAAAVADELGADVLDASEPIADLAELAAAEVGLEAKVGAGDGALSGFELERSSFDLGDDPFASLDQASDEPSGEGDLFAATDVFAAADEPATAAEEAVSELLDDEAALVAEPEEAPAGEVSDEVLLADALLADLDAVEVSDEDQARELGEELTGEPSIAATEEEPSIAVAEEADEAEPEEAEPEDATTMIQAMPEEAEPEDATAMIQATPDEAEPEGATTMIQATPDEAAREPEPVVEIEVTPEPEPEPEEKKRPTRRSRRSSRKAKKK